MSRESENLSHHEQKRLEYLYSNYHYLNEKEQLEYQYLKQKSEGQIEQVVVPALEEDIQESAGKSEVVFDDLPVYPSRTRKSKAKDSGVEPMPKLKQSKKPKKKIRVKRVLKWLAVFLLLVIIGMVIMFFKGLNSKPRGDAKPAVQEYFNGQKTKDGVNILILGTDGRIGESSEETRTDSIMVVNVNNKSGKVKMVSFMRDTLVHIDGVSQQSEPDYSDYYDQKLNTAFTIGEQNNNQGAELVRQMLKDNFDIDIQYYAMVDFQTFATAIDTLFPNGVEMNAQFSKVDGEKVSEVEVPDDLNMKDGVVPNQTIKVGKQRMDGRTLLNYSRFRKDDEGDFGRTRRQQEVMSAIVHQIKDPTKLFTGSEALGKVFAMTSTNIPFSFLLTNGIGLVGSASKGIERITIPENGDWVDAYDMYGGQGLLVDFEAYKNKLSQMGLR
ncbi:LytR family transcriptional regulator [Streptococcus rubneri]|uniref:Regulatory protein MsrR n=1 Tax=Streptococcus rubneri TaxID=1234680 RepID=A0A4Z1DXK7_9STRE|nr:LCP family protein [Streptococcus rubneri]MBK4774269.1 LytR family transcriptional regulator [Streptococcus rubneri]TGN92100.1 LytR family transcriptional regulator [Streptococcus rubneri]